MANKQPQSCPTSSERANGNKERKESTPSLRDQPNVFHGNNKTVKSSYHQNHNKFGLNCMSYNAESLMNKRSELELILRDQNPDIVFITETLPKYDVREAEQIDGYVLYVNEKQKRGVCICVKETLVCDQIKYFTDVEEKMDMLWLTMNLNRNDKLLIGCVYRSPNNTERENEEMMAELVRAAQSQCSHILITGDLNYSNTDWEAFSAPHDTDYRQYRIKIS